MRRKTEVNRFQPVFRPPAEPREAHGGIKAYSENGEFGKNWWAKRWLMAMERLTAGLRLQRAQRYARQGQVLSIDEIREGVTARVQGSRVKPYKVSIRLTPFSNGQWEKVLDVLAGQAIFAAQLLAGEMPVKIEDAFSVAGVNLFPVSSSDITSECSCPDSANPCKHIAATYYILGDRFDEDPFLLFRMRGRTQEQILAGLQKRRQPKNRRPRVEMQVKEDVPALETLVDRFWDPGKRLENIPMHVSLPSVNLPLLKRLGQPDFARGLLVSEELGSAYESISQAAMVLAFSDSAAPPPENGEKDE